MNYNELMSELTNNTTGGLNIEKGCKGKFSYLTASGEFVGRRCRDCGRTMQAEHLKKHSGTKHGHDSICLSCMVEFNRKRRSCDDYRRKEAEQQKKYSAETVDGRISKIIYNISRKAKRDYGIIVPKPTDAERQLLKHRMQSALENGCAYSGKPLTWENVSCEHLTPISRNGSVAFEMTGSLYGVIFVDKTENYRKQARSFLEYAKDWEYPKIIESIERIAVSLGVPYGTVEQAIMLDDLKTLAIAQ